MTTPTLPPLVLTVQEAADMLKYKKSKIYDMLQKSQIRGIGEGRGRRIPVSELERWLQEQLHGKAQK